MICTKIDKLSDIFIYTWGKLLGNFTSAQGKLSDFLSGEPYRAI